MGRQDAEAVGEPAIEAGQHLLSQKPFVLDLDVGEALCAKAEARGVHQLETVRSVCPEWVSYGARRGARRG